MVTKDIPPYAILAGNPAKIIRYRFDSETIDELLKIKWWEWEDKKIGEFLPDLMNGDIKQFINKSNKLS